MTIYTGKRKKNWKSLRHSGSFRLEVNMRSNESKNALKKTERYSLHMINGNGYDILRRFNSINSCINFAKQYPLSVFFAWIYDTKKDEMVMQNDYGNNFFKCNNENFIPYWC